MNNIKRKNDEEKVIINVPTNKNPLVQQAQDYINASEEIRTLWQVINVNAIDRLQMTDHGPIHFQLVSNIAIKLARMLEDADIELSIQKDHQLSRNHGELVIYLASLFHDLGMTINRRGHEEFSLIIANTVLRDVLQFLPVKERTIVISETLHAIISHRKGGTPYTLEAGIVRVADALDMTSGRSRSGIEAGHQDIHAVSHASIDKVEILKGEKKPILIDISMNNSAGLFQLDELLKEKIKGSGLEEYISVKASVKAETEKSLVKEFFID